MTIDVNGESLDNVLVAPIQPGVDLARGAYYLYLPKTCSRSWSDRDFTTFYGRKWHVIGPAERWQSDLIPLSWNDRVTVSRYPAQEDLGVVIDIITAEGTGAVSPEGFPVTTETRIPVKAAVNWTDETETVEGVTEFTENNVTFLIAYRELTGNAEIEWRGRRYDIQSIEDYLLQGEYLRIKAVSKEAV